MNSYTIEDLKSLKKNVTHNIADGEPISNNVEYSFTNPQEVSIHSSNGDRSLPLFSRADVEVNLYKIEEEGAVPTNNFESIPRYPSLQSIRAILQITDDEIESNDCKTSHSYQRSVKIIRKLDGIVNKMKMFTETAKRKLKMKTYKKDSDKVFKKYLNESQDLFEELQKYHTNKRPRRDSCNYGNTERSFCNYSVSSDGSVRSPSPKRHRFDTSKNYGHSSKHYDTETFLHNKSSQSRKSSGDKNRSHRAASVDSISSINSGSEEEIYEQENSKSKNDRTYEKHSRSRHSRRAPMYSDWWYDRSYFNEMSAKEFERYYRYSYYAVMYVFPVIMDRLRQDDLNNF